MRRFLDCEKWRRSVDLDNLVPSWEYTEREEMFQYYPQYYHKTDKVTPKASGRQFPRNPEL